VRNRRFDERTAMATGGWEVEEGGRLLLPGASRAAGIPFCCPVGSDRALAL